VRGEGGKKSAPVVTPPPVEAPNSLRARSRIRALFALSEGPIAGFSNVLRQIYLDGVPLVDANGKTNFEGVTVETRNGDATQPPFNDFPVAEDTFAVSVKVEQAATPPVRTLDCTARDRIRVIVQVSALYLMDDKGNIGTNRVEWALDWRIAGGGGWVQLHAGAIDGKCMSPYQRAVTLPVPHNGMIELRLRRVSPDPADSKNQSELFWVSYASILDQKLTYPGTALVAIGFDATNQGGTMPQVTFEPDGGILCEVPVNYNPATRVYTGMWDGTFKKAWTDNPAWIFWTLATNPDWGGGAALSAGLTSPAAAYSAATGLVDKWALYTIGQYCDELVPNGLGGTEPRYRFNAWIDRADEAYRVLQAIAGVFRAMVYWGRGQIVPVADMPRNPVKLVSKVNVINGAFEYSVASLRARHSVVRVRWRDPALQYRENVAVVEDADMMAEIGVRPIDYEALGCTSLAQAIRMGKWVLYTEKYESGLLTYRAALDHITVAPGEVIAVQDEDRAGVAFSGRLARSRLSTTYVQLDRPVTLVGGQTYSLRIVYEDGTLSALLPITTPASTTDTLTLGTALAQNVLPEAVWMIYASNIEPETYQVVHIEEQQDGSFEVSALRHHAGKFNYIELGWALPGRPETMYPTNVGAMSSPTNLVIREYLTGVGGTPLVRVVFSWSFVTDPRVVAFEARWIKGGIVSPVQTVTETSVEFADLVPGTYSFQVRALGGAGNASAWVTLDNQAVDGQADPPAPPSALQLLSGIRNVQVNWTRPAGLYTRNFEVWAATTGFNNLANDATTNIGSAPAFGAFSKIGDTDGTSFVHADLLPSHVWWYMVRTIDVFGQWSTFVGPAGVRTSQLVAADIRDGIINTAKFASSISPVGLVTSGGVPASKAEDVIYHTPTNRLYRWDVGAAAYVAVVRTSELDGALAATNFPTGLRPVEVVSSLPSTGNFEGRVVMLTTDDKLYRHNGTAWISTVAAADVSGALAAGNFPNSLRPVEVVATLPASGNFAGRMAFLTTDNKLYRHNGTAWIASLAATDLTGSITSTQITDGAISTPKLAAGAVTASELAANAVTANKILAGAVSAAAIAAGAISASKLVVGDTSNIFPDFDAIDPGFWAGPHSFVGQTSAAFGRQALVIPFNASTIASDSGYIQVEPGAEYRVEMGLACEVAGALATGQVVWFSMNGSGVLTYLSADTFASSDVTAAARYGANVVAPATARRAVIRLTRWSGGTGGVTGGGVVMRRRATGSLIVDGAITAAKIATDAVEAAKIQADAVTATKIAAGAVTADKIAANSIVASKVMIGDTSNVFPDYDCEDSSFWTGDHTFATMGIASYGRRELRIPMGASDTQSLSGYFMVEPSTSYWIEGALRCDTAGDTVTLVIEWYTLTGGGVPSYSSETVIGTSTSTSWSRPGLAVTSGSSIRRARIRFRRTAGGTSQVRCGGVMIRRRAIGNLIVDGSITAEKIAANAITANEIAANAITASELAADSVVFGKVAAGAIKSAQIATGEIRATHMASETILTQTGQIADLIVAEAKIQGEAVSHVFQATQIFDPPWYNISWAHILSARFYSNSARTGLLACFYRVGKNGSASIGHSINCWVTPDSGGGGMVAEAGGDIWFETAVTTGFVYVPPGWFTLNIYVSSGANAAFHRVHPVLFLRSR
jgi:predicted phage tail protein